MRNALACLLTIAALQGAGAAALHAQTDPNSQLRDLGLPPAVTPNLPPALNPNLPPPTGKRYLPGASGPFADPDQPARKTPVPQGYSSSSQWIRGEIRSGEKWAQAAPAPSAQLNRIGEIVPYLRRCWVVPTGVEARVIDATVRMSLSRDGKVIGVPKIAYVNKAATEEQRQSLLRSIASAIRACEPFPLSVSLGNAVAGRIFSVRFVVEPTSTSL